MLNVKSTVLTLWQGHDAKLPHLLHLESITVEPTAKDPHHSRLVYSLTVTKELCNMGGTSPALHTPSLLISAR